MMVKFDAQRYCDRAQMMTNVFLSETQCAVIILRL